MSDDNKNGPKKEPNHEDTGWFLWLFAIFAWVLWAVLITKGIL